MADHAPAQYAFEREHRRDFVLQHLAGRDAGPRRDHFADGLPVDAHAHQRILALQRDQLGCERIQFFALLLALTAGSARLFKLRADVAQFENQIPLLW